MRVVVKCSVMVETSVTVVVDSGSGSVVTVTGAAVAVGASSEVERGMMVLVWTVKVLVRLDVEEMVGTRDCGTGYWVTVVGLKVTRSVDAGLWPPTQLVQGSPAHM